MKQHRKKLRGFTLIELMIVIVIIAILASIAFPSYQDSVRKTKRANVQATLMELSIYLERRYTENNNYTGTTIAGSGLSDDEYDLTIPTLTASTFIIQAKAKAGSGQNSDTGCVTLTISQTGAKTPASCW